MEIGSEGLKVWWKAAYVIIIQWRYTLVQEQVDAGNFEEDSSERKPQESKTQSESVDEFEEIKGDWFYHYLHESLPSLCK